MERGQTKFVSTFIDSTKYRIFPCRVITVTNGHVLSQGAPIASAENANVHPPQAPGTENYFRSLLLRFY